MLLKKTTDCGWWWPLLVCFLIAVSSSAGAENTPSATSTKVIGATPTVYPDWFKDSFLDFEEDVYEATLAQKRLVLLFHQDNCPYCNLLVERNLAQKDIRDLLQEKFDVVALNLWGDREIVSIGGGSYTEKSFAAALKIQHTPTLLFFNEEGKAVLRLNGYVPPITFKRALDYVSQKREKKQGWHNYLATHRVMAPQRKLNQQDFFIRPPYDLSLHAGLWDKPLAVFFEQSHCPDCDRLHRYVLNNPKTQELLKRFRSVQFNMWSKAPVITPDGRQVTARQWANELEVMYAPSIIMFNNKGVEIMRLEAFFKNFHTQSALEYVANQAYKEEPNFPRYLRERSKKLREAGQVVSLEE